MANYIFDATCPESMFYQVNELLIVVKGPSEQFFSYIMGKTSYFLKR
jgi:hypothetical protein